MKNWIGILLFISIFLSSCNSIMYRVLGVEKVEIFDEHKYEKKVSELLKEYPGPSSAYVVQDSSMVKYIHLYDSVFYKNAGQPIQLLYFKDQKLVSFNANCYSPFKTPWSINWNYDVKFDHYIPKSAVDISDVNLNLGDLLNAIQMEKVDSLKKESDVIVMFWSRTLNKHVSDLNRVVVKNALQNSSGRLPHIVYLNTDYFFASKDNQLL